MHSRTERVRKPSRPGCSLSTPVRPVPEPLSPRGPTVSEPGGPPPLPQSALLAVRLTLVRYGDAHVRTPQGGVAVTGSAVRGQRCATVSG